MAADELDPEPLETELALAAQLQDQPFFAFQDLAPWGAVRPTALLLQPGPASTVACSKRAPAGFWRGRKVK